MPPHLVAVLVLASLAGVVWTAFPLFYHCLTGGRWRGTQHGRNVMALGISLAVTIDVTVLSALGLIPEAVAFWAQFVLWPALAVVGAQRLALLWRDQHPAK